MAESENGIRGFYDASAIDLAEKWYADETMRPILERFLGFFERGSAYFGRGLWNRAREHAYG